MKEETQEEATSFIDVAKKYFNDRNIVFENSTIKTNEYDQLEIRIKLSDIDNNMNRIQRAYLKHYKKYGLKKEILGKKINSPYGEIIILGIDETKLSNSVSVFNLEKDRVEFIHPDKIR